MAYVVDPIKEQVNADLGITAKESEAELLRAAQHTIEEYINLYDGKQRVVWFTPRSIPEEEILSIAKEWKADLIVMGTHGCSAIGRILSRSKVEYVVRYATVPVLLTPPPVCYNAFSWLLIVIGVRSKVPRSNHFLKVIWIMKIARLKILIRFGG